MRRVILLLPIVLFVPACSPSDRPVTAPTTASDRTFDRLLRLMQQRLEVMHDVARYKWAKKAPIEDPEREAALLDDVASRAIELGLESEFVRSFFRGQIEAAKMVQRADFSRWEAAPRGPEGEVPDLTGVLRPRIDTLNRDLLAELAKVSYRMNPDAVARLLERADCLVVGPGIDGEAREAAMLPLVEASKRRGGISR